ELLKQANNGNGIEVVITDYQMPGMSGYELASQIKSTPSISDTSLILLTSTSQKGDAFKAKEKGFQAYLSKPIKRDELIGCVMLVTGLEQGEDKNESIITKYSQQEVKMANMPRILLAEDNAINRKVVVHILKNKGLTCDIAENGREAYQACLVKNYDIVFMDCQMPVMDGYQAAEKIREAEKGNRHTKIIAMTANAMEGDREKCINAGMDDYISKPINFETIIKMIEESFQQETKKMQYDFVDKGMEAFISSSGLEVNDVKEIYDDYIDSMPNMLNNIGKAVKSDDFEGLKVLAHQFKGSSGNLRIDEVYELALKLEEFAKGNDKSNCERTFSEIKKLFKL
ncbi:MAG: response regulator, partial [Ignavibacteriales bacterium]